MRSLLPLIIIIALFALLFMGPMRRQKRMAAEAQQLRSQLAPGDRGMTTSGLYGTITKIDDDSVTIEISPGVPVQFAKAAVGQKVSDGGGYASGEGYAGSDRAGEVDDEEAGDVAADDYADHAPAHDETAGSVAEDTVGSEDAYSSSTGPSSAGDPTPTDPTAPDPISSTGRSGQGRTVRRARRTGP